MRTAREDRPWHLSLSKSDFVRLAFRWSGLNPCFNHLNTGMEGDRRKGNYQLLSHYIALIQTESQTLTPEFTGTEKMILRNQAL